jgi:glycosyltransferase involved in cell wall biosynthesis
MINVVHLHIVYDNCKTGIDRYLEMFNNATEERLKSHVVYFVRYAKKIFPQIEIANNGCVKAILPIPESELLYKNFWRKKYFIIVAEILTPYIKEMTNLFFHSHNLFFPELTEELKRKFGGKIITHMHCIPWKYSMDKNKSLFNTLNRLYIDKEYESFKNTEKSEITYQTFDMIICLSEAAKDYLIKIHGTDDRKIKIIYNGIRLKKDIVDCKRKRNPIEILYAGKVSKDKGIYELLDALKIVNSKGYHPKIKIAGVVSSTDQQIIKSCYTKLDINILGEISIDELQGLYSACTMGIIPSLHEQCSYVALEMAVSGTPMIVSDVDALAEIFEHENTALLTPLVFDSDFGLSVDKEKLAENIIRLINDEGLRNKLSNNVRKLCEDKFRLDMMMDKTIEVYKQLM